jgi:hypothetical protein
MSLRCVKIDKEYSGSLTGEPILLHETKIVARRMLNGENEKEIREIIYDTNEFGHKTKKSIKKHISSILRRLKKIDKNLMKYIVEDLSNDGKIVIVFSITLEDRLFKELIYEDISYKMLIREYEYSIKDIQRFINKKSEISDKINSFSPTTKYRLSVTMFNILKESGIIIIKENKSYLKSNLSISNSLKKDIEKENDNFLKCIGVNL